MSELGNAQARLDSIIQSKKVSESNDPIKSQSIGIRITVYQSAMSMDVYEETNTAYINSKGVALFEIGKGEIEHGKLKKINWLDSALYMRTESDPTGSFNYSLKQSFRLRGVPKYIHYKDGRTKVIYDADSLNPRDEASMLVTDTSFNQKIKKDSNAVMNACNTDSVCNNSLTYGSVVDIDQNVYKTIVIGGQEWMAENLRVCHYRNGEPIQNIIEPTAWYYLSSGGSCWLYNDSSRYHCAFGKLYNWYVTKDERLVCPAGWHVPSNDEWSRLIDFLDPNAKGGEAPNTAGRKMKSVMDASWQQPKIISDNSSGFSAIPSSIRYDFGPFGSLHREADWWTSTANDASTAWYRVLRNINQLAEKNFIRKTAGLSIRCVKD